MNTKPRNPGHSLGFTLIEILVVVAIVSFIASTVMFNIQKARSAGRDIYRLESARQVLNALEDYYSTHGHYPCSWEVWSTEEQDWMSWIVSEGYSTQVPRDPINRTDGDGEWAYSYSTFKNAPGGPCGQHVVYTFTMEKPGNCHLAGVDYNFEHHHGIGTHCHIFWPSIFPIQHCLDPGEWQPGQPIPEWAEQAYIDYPASCGVLYDGW